MGILIGAPKYFIGVLLAPWGFFSMYVFGGTVDTFLNTLQHLFSGNFLEAFVEYFIFSALPPTSLAHIVYLAVLGAFIAMCLWFIAMFGRGVAL